MVFFSFDQDHGKNTFSEIIFGPTKNNLKKVLIGYVRKTKAPLPFIRYTLKIIHYYVCKKNNLFILIQFHGIFIFFKRTFLKKLLEHGGLLLTEFEVAKGSG